MKKHVRAIPDFAKISLLLACAVQSPLIKAEQCLADLASGFLSAAVSPDGAWLAYTVASPALEVELRLLKLDQSPQSSRLLAKHVKLSTSIAWHPGSQILAAVELADNEEVLQAYSVDLDQEKRPVWRAPELAGGVAWTSDGHHIVIGEDSVLRLINAESRAEVRSISLEIANGLYVELDRLAVSPSGVVAFAASERGTAGGVAIWTVDIWKNAAVANVVTRGGEASSPIWIGDETIVFSREESPDESFRHLWRVGPEGVEERLTEGLVIDFPVGWNPAAGELAFSSIAYDVDYIEALAVERPVRSARGVGGILSMIEEDFTEAMLALQSRNRLMLLEIER